MGYSSHTESQHSAPSIAAMIISMATVTLCAVFIHAFLFPSPALSNQNIMFEKIDYKDGLSQSSVICIYKDSKGFMWFGTQDGLYQYDGYSFIVYRHSPFDNTSIGTSSIIDIFEYNGKIWLATLNDGLYRLDQNDKFSNYNYDPDNENSLSSNHINAIESHGGFFWVATDQGLTKFDPATGNCIRYTHDSENEKSLSSNLIQKILYNGSDDLLITTNVGLDILTVSNNAITRYVLPKSRRNTDNSIMRSIYQESKDSYWIGTFDGLEHFDHNTGEFKNVKTGHPFHRINCIEKDESGNLWLGTRNDGLIRFDPLSGNYDIFKHDRLDSSSISSDEIRSLFFDEYGTIWIGTINGGINKIKRRSFQIVNYSELQGQQSLNNRLVYSIFEDSKGIIWIGTGGGGLNRLDTANNTVDYYVNNDDDPKSLINNTVTSILEDSNGTFWVGTAGGGAQIMDRETGEFSRYQLNSQILQLSSVYILSIMEDSKHRLWFCTVHGLNMLDLSSGKFESYLHDPDNRNSISSNYIFSIHETSDGSLWVGTDNGINKLDPDKRTIKRYQHDSEDRSSISGSIAWNVFEDSKNRIWIGTWGGGLNLYSPETETFRHFTTENGLPNNIIYGILEDSNGKLWMSTNEGISSFDPGNFSFRNYSSEDGLIGNEFSMGACFKNSAGDMFFGGTYGLSVFNPAHIVKNHVIPPIYITRITTSKTATITINDVIELDNIVVPYTENSFSIEFASLDYTSPGKNSYRYKLNGFEKDWVNSGKRRSAWYTDLSPGEYVFRVTGTNSDGEWNPIGASLKITVTPPFWGTMWFKILIGAFIIAVTIGTYTVRVDVLKARSERLSRFTDYLHSAIEKERNHISREIHDELGQALTGIKMSLSLLKRGQVGPIAKQRERIESITELIDTTINKTRNISENLRPSRLDELGLIPAIEWYVTKFEESTGIESVMDIDTDEINFGHDDNIALFRIVQESLTNVARHANASEVTVSMVQFNNRIELRVTDNGKGIQEDESRNTKSFGLMGMRERAKTLNATFEIRQNITKGTVVIVIIPLTGDVS